MLADFFSILREGAMEKPADTQYPIHDVLRQRWSPRAFDDRSIEPEKLRSLFEAARWAPSSNNQQPWRFLVAVKENKVEYDRLFNCLVDANQTWAHRAPVLLLSVAELQFEDGSQNRHAFHDTGMAAENLVIQATALGLVAHQMAGFRIDQARADCQIPHDYEPVAMIAVGYPGDSSLLSDRLRAREVQPRVRKPVTEFVYSTTWEQPLPLLR
jgi:nitroreductase